MSAVPPPNNQQQQQQQQTGAPAPGGGAPQGAPPPTPPVQTPAQGLPPTGIDQQLSTINAITPPAQQPGQQPTQTPTGGSTSIQQLARSLAQNYGLAVGRGNIVDEQGNFLMTPDQMAVAGGAKGGYGGLGEEMSTTAAKMNYISQAIANAQNRQQQEKGIAAIQTGLGQVQSRGRGSLASMQSGMYQDLADLYSNQEYEAADFSYFIQQGMMNEAQAQAHRARKRGKKSARMGMIGSLAGAAIGGAFGMPGAGAAIGGGVGQAGAAGGWF